MSQFFNSDVVRDTVVELSEMQHKIVMQMQTMHIMTSDQRKSHLQEMKAFLEKQKLFFFRISLSDDKEAIEMKERLMDASKLFGIHDEVNSMESFFHKLDETIKELEESIDN